MAEVRKFQPVEIPDYPEPLPQPDSKLTEAAAAAVSLALKALSQRALAGGKALATLVSVGSCFWLWNATPNPTATQIVSLSIYALFILAANVIVRKL